MEFHMIFPEPSRGFSNGLSNREQSANREVANGQYRKLQHIIDPLLWSHVEIAPYCQTLNKFESPGKKNGQLSRFAI